MNAAAPALLLALETPAAGQPGTVREHRQRLAAVRTLRLLFSSMPARTLHTLLAALLLRPAPVAAMGHPPPMPSPGLAPGKPNIIIIVADDLGYGDPGCYGQQRITTPRLDRMAAEGMRFTQFYAGAPMCAPSRATLMTGVHPGHGNVDRNERPNLPLASNETTFAEHLARQGYHTVFVGKWGLGGATPNNNFGGTYPQAHLPAGGGNELLPETAHSLPTRKGFASSLAVLDHAYAHQHFPEYIWENETPTPIAGNIGRPQAQRTVYAQDMFTERALAALRRASTNAPLCMVVAYLLPHRQLVFPPGVNPYAHQPWPSNEQAFAAMITKLDTDVGRLLDAIDAHPALASNTLVFFTSDNGPHAADGHAPAFFNSAGGLRGMKFTLWEGGIRVPAIARWPGRITAGAVQHAPCGFVDLCATVRDLAGALPAASAACGDGVSIVPLFGGATTLARTTPLIWYAPPGDNPRAPVAALRNNQWKFVLLADGTPELFNLDDDPAEHHTLTHRHDELVREYYRALTQQVRQPLPPLRSSGATKP